MRRLNNKHFVGGGEGGGEEDFFAFVFEFLMCSHCVSIKFWMGSHHAPKMLPKFSMGSVKHSQ
jgi:uncharacterized protein with PIN domain